MTATSKRPYWLAIVTAVLFLPALVSIEAGVGLNLPAPIDAFSNFARVTLMAGYGVGAHSVTVADGQGATLPSPAPFNCTWYDSTTSSDPTNDPDREIVRVTAVVGDVLTILRGQEGTLEVAHNASGKIYRLDCALTAKTLTDIALGLANSVGVVNIWKYGAAGDGSTDDTAAIQAALDVAYGTSGTCQSVYLPYSNYKLTGELAYYNRTTPGAKDCGVVFGEGRGSQLLWYGPYYQSPIRVVGSFQTLRDLAITAETDWIAGVDYSGSNSNKVGTVSTGRTTTATLSHVWIDTNNFHGDGVAIGRYGYQSDMLLLDQVYIRDCIHGNGVKSFNSNTQSMKYMGGVVSHCHVAFGKNSTTNFIVSGTEIDSNDINFSPSGGGTIVVTGGRTENAKRWYFDNNGTAGGPRIFDGVQYSNIVTARPPTTATTYTTLATPSSPSVVATGSGSTTWGYKIACFDAGVEPSGTTAPTGHTASSAEVTVTNAAVLDATHFNTLDLSAVRSPGASSCGWYRTKVGGSPASTGTIAFVPYFANGVVIDNGLPGDNVIPPTTNTTTNTVILSTAGLIEGDLIALDGAGPASAAGVLVTQITDCYDLTHCHLSVAPTADVASAQIVLKGECTATWASGTTITFSNPCVAGNETIAVTGAGVGGANLTTTLTAASCTFPGSPRTMVCDGTATVSTPVSAAAVRSTTNVYWQNAFMTGQSGPYHIRGSVFQSTTRMQHSATRPNAMLYEGNYWVDPAMADPFGRLSPSCTMTSIGNVYGSPPAPMASCIYPTLPFGTTTSDLTLAGDLSLTSADALYQYLNPGGADRIVTIATSAVAKVVQNTGGANTLTLKDETGATIAVVSPGSTVSVMYTGTSWRIL